MVREIAISVYLFVFRILFNSFKIFPQKKKTVAVTSFGDNIFYATKALRDISSEDIIILKDSSCHYQFNHSITEVISFSKKQPFAFLKSIYHLATAKNILIDNYFGFLSVTQFKPGTTCIQLWHAAGALKQFGLQDPSTSGKSRRAIDRFRKVYGRFDYTVVGSEKMADIFKDCFALTDNRILRYGVPRTDFFFNLEEYKKSYNRLKHEFPSFNDKKIILYAPTFRSGKLTNSQLEVDIKQLYDNLSEEYILIVKFHPAVTYTLPKVYEDFIFDLSSYNDTNALLLITDILITDYSSIPFEFSLLDKPTIFYAYDKEEYKKTNGLIEDYDNNMPGPIVSTTEEIVSVIKQNNFDIQATREFAKIWNAYSMGNSSLNVAKLLAGIVHGTGQDYKNEADIEVPNVKQNESAFIRKALT
ncbi:CDP-glycerol glycerophosphotransferase family protein [Oceanobacillus massiliensis]|uniref:CDP-glycerol glycerophosphotransferase family protein n=1 Tax=Oceanobacillus massiliensis TaxID=1465765 RepID=UPI0030185C41